MNGKTKVNKAYKQQNASDLPRQQGDEIELLLHRIILLLEGLISKTDPPEGLATMQICISEIDPSPYYPFKIDDDEDIDKLAVSILVNGLITPVIVREKGDGRYEILSGYRRLKACELAGLDTISCEIVEADDEMAAVMIVESNRQRCTMTASEKGYAYRALRESIQYCKNSFTAICNSMGLDYEVALPINREDSNTYIQQCIRLTEVIPEIQDMVDEKRVGIKQAVEFSYLPKLIQGKIWEMMELEGRTFSLGQAKRIRELYEKHELCEDILEKIINEEKPNQREITRRTEKINKLLPQGLSARQRNDYILKPLDYYNNRTV